jgi:hypothetical protein
MLKNKHSQVCQVLDVNLSAIVISYIRSPFTLSIEMSEQLGGPPNACIEIFQLDSASKQKKNSQKRLLDKLLVTPTLPAMQIVEPMRNSILHVFQDDEVICSVPQRGGIPEVLLFSITVTLSLVHDDATQVSNIICNLITSEISSSSYSEKLFVIRNDPLVSL